MRVEEERMKEIRMEKLIELLNEYETVRWKENKNKDIKRLNKWCERYIARWFSNLYIISKKFWFIKWLVDNDKIDRKHNDLAFSFSSVYTYNGEDYENHLKECKLLMLLSIQDNPIEFLISILKDKKVRTVYVDEDWNVSWDTKRYSDC